MIGVPITNSRDIVKSLNDIKFETKLATRNSSTLFDQENNDGQSVTTEQDHKSAD